MSPFCPIFSPPSTAAAPADADSGRKLIGDLEPDRITSDLDAVYNYVNGAARPSSRARSGRSDSAGAADRASATRRTIPTSRRSWSVTGRRPIPPRSSGSRRRCSGSTGKTTSGSRARCRKLPRRCSRPERRSPPEVFPGTGHGFLKPGRQGSDGPQVERAWKRILEFYRARLGQVSAALTW